MKKTGFKFLGVDVYTDETLRSYTGYDIVFISKLPDNWPQMEKEQQEEYLKTHSAIIKNIKNE